MICDWCGYETPSYAEHFADPNFAGCRQAALRPAPRVTRLDADLTSDQIRRRALRTLARTGRQDRIEGLARNTIRRRDWHHEHRLQRNLTQPPG